MSSDLKRRAIGIIAGRDRVPAEDAVWAFGLVPSPGRVSDMASRHGVVVGDDGTVSARDVLRAMDRAAAVRRAGRRPVFDADVDVELSRIHGRGWKVTLNWHVLGTIELLPRDGGDSEAPLRWLGAWSVVPAGGGAPFFAVCDRAAQWLLVEAAGEPVNPPGWARHVRRLDRTEADEVQRIAEALAGGGAGDSTMLTHWEIRNLTVVENPRWRQLHPDPIGAVAEDDDPGNDDEDPANVPTPAGLALVSESNLRGRQWGMGAVAEYLLVSRSTVENYRRRGQMPACDGMTGRSPWWRPETIARWKTPHSPAGGAALRRLHKLAGDETPCLIPSDQPEDS